MKYVDPDQGLENVTPKALNVLKTGLARKKTNLQKLKKKHEFTFFPRLIFHCKSPCQLT